jgi:hypothetical protein
MARDKYIAKYLLIVWFCNGINPFVIILGTCKIGDLAHPINKVVTHITMGCGTNCISVLLLADK